jgi:hypothetical protein
VTVTGGTVEVPDAPEPRAGYFVASHARPVFVTDLSSQQIDDVFDLLYEDAANRPSQSSQSGTNGHSAEQAANRNSINGDSGAPA